MLNISDPAAASTRVSMRGKGNSSFGQNLLRVVKSMHIHQLPFFFGTMTTLASHSGYFADYTHIEQFLDFVLCCFLVVFGHCAKALLPGLDLWVDPQRVFHDFSADSSQV